MITAAAPGKIMLAGEWGVLEPDCGCIVLPTPYFMKVEIKPFDEFLVDLTSLDLSVLKAVYAKNKFSWIEKKHPCKTLKKAEFVRLACEKALNFLELKQVALKPFLLKTFGFDLRTKEKIGLGSSAAVVTAVLKAILVFHQVFLEKKDLYKLGVLVHYDAQNKMGSGFDIAASVYEKSLYYHGFAQSWLKKFISKNNLLDLLKTVWPDLKIEAIAKPLDAIILVGWTEKSSSTSALISLFKKFKKEKPEKWKKILTRLKTVVLQTKQAIDKKDNVGILSLIQENHRLLLQLGKHIPIYTNKLKLLAKIAEKNNFAGKLSGAGGGDCGIALGYNRRSAELIKKQWQKAGIQVLFEI